MKSYNWRHCVDAVLAALFLVALFALGAATLYTDGGGIRAAFTARRRVRDFLENPADATDWDWFAARVRSLDDYLTDHLFLGDELGHANARFQNALGKRLIQSGSHPLLLLKNGQLYEPQTAHKPMTAAAQSVAALRTSLPTDTPFLFVYAHPGVYEKSQFPEGYAALDHSDEMADELLEILEAGGVSLLDSRKVLRGSGLSPDQYLLRTDNHWATRAALEMARAAAAEVDRRSAIRLQAELLDIHNFESRTYPGLFLGGYGQRVGTELAPPDDITIYWPRYHTNIRRRTEYLGEYADETGEFRESVIRWRYLRVPDEESWNTVAYFDYGLTENVDYYQNPNATDCTILLLKDSFTAAMGSFLSLVADEVCAVDLRRSDRTVREWIDQTQPDIVIAAFSLPYLLGEDYEFA